MFHYHFRQEICCLWGTCARSWGAEKNWRCWWWRRETSCNSENHKCWGTWWELYIWMEVLAFQAFIFNMTLIWLFICADKKKANILKSAKDTSLEGNNDEVRKKGKHKKSSRDKRKRRRRYYSSDSDSSSDSETESSESDSDSDSYLSSSSDISSSSDDRHRRRKRSSKRDKHRHGKRRDRRRDRKRKRRDKRCKRRSRRLIAQIL